MADGDVKPGQSFRPTAGEWNDFRHAARLVKEQSPIASAPSQKIAKEADIFHCKSKISPQLDSFDVLQLCSPSILPTDNENEFKFRTRLAGKTPTGDVGRAVVLAEPIAEDRYGRVTASAVTPAKVNFSNPNHRCAEAKDGDTSQLYSRAHGSIQVLWKAPGSGLQWALVRIGNASGCILATAPDDGIPAKSGTTLGKATCTVQTIDDNDDHADYYIDGKLVTMVVHNSVSSIVTGLIQAQPEWPSGRYLANVEDCG